MEKKKSDFKRFCETMWIMAKYDALPWMIGAGILAAVLFGLQDSKSQNKVNDSVSSLFQKQR